MTQLVQKSLGEEKKNICKKNIAHDAHSPPQPLHPYISKKNSRYSWLKGTVKNIMQYTGIGIITGTTVLNLYRFVPVWTVQRAVYTSMNSTTRGLYRYEQYNARFTPVWTVQRAVYAGKKGIRFFYTSENPIWKSQSFHWIFFNGQSHPPPHYSGWKKYFYFIPLW